MKQNINRGINYLMYCSGLLVTTTGIALAWKLKRGTELLGLSRHEWGDIHLWVGIVLAAAVVAHLVMHWRWIWQVASKRVPWLAWVGIAPPLIICLAALSLPVDQRSPRMANRHPALKTTEPSVDTTMDETPRLRYGMRGRGRSLR